MRTEDGSPSVAPRRAAAVGGILLLLTALLVWLLTGGRAVPEAGAPAAPQSAPPDAPPAPLTVEGLAAPPHGSAPPRAQPRDAPEPEPPEEVAAPARTPHLPLHLETMDASSGRTLGVPWALLPPEADVSAQALGTGPQLLPLSEDGVAQAEFALGSSPGFVPWDEQRIRVTVARRARALRHVHPLRPEVPAHLVVRDPDGRRAHDFTVDAVVAGRRVTVRWDPLAASGRFGGLPFLRGERVQLLVREASSAGGHGARAALWERRLSDNPHEPLHAEVTLPAEVPRPPLRLEEGVGGIFLGRFDRRYPSGKGALGRLEVTLLGRDGKPLPDTRVLVPSSRARGWTDARGFVAFDRVVGGECQVLTEEAGVVETRATARVVPGDTCRITMREAEGATVEVLVVDEEGRFLPCAALMLALAGQPFCDISDDGVQRTDLFTDAFGRRTLAHVPPGALHLGARHGERTAEERIEVRDGEVTLVRLVVR